MDDDGNLPAISREGGDEPDPGSQRRLHVSMNTVSNFNTETVRSQACPRSLLESLLVLDCLRRNNFSCITGL